MSVAALPPAAALYRTVLREHGSYSAQMQPFPHLQSASCLLDEHYQALAATFPAPERFAPGAARLDNTVLRISSSRVLREAGFASEWRWFVDAHTSPAFWRQIVRAYGDRIRCLYPDIEELVGRPLEDWRVARRGDGRHGDVTLECQLVINTPPRGRASGVKAPHVDHVNKLWTGLFYMRHPDDESEGGDLELYASDAPVAFDAHQAPRSGVHRACVVSYRANSFVGFVNGARAVHAVSPRGFTPHVRRYVDFVAEMDHPVFALRQMSAGRRLFFRLFQRERSR